MSRQSRGPVRVPSVASALAASLVLVAGLAGCSGSSDGSDSSDDAAPVVTAKPVTRPLSILMVNDDGWDAPGITAAYDALVAAGQEVTLVAPLENQSGASMSSTSGTLAVTRPEGTDEPKYAVDGTPVDSLNIGLRGVLKADPPDLVISGVNTGANVAGNTNYSGTVGAAAAAAEQGIPALAVSADVGGPSGGADFDDAAKVVVELVASLAATGFDGLGADGFVNVNVPFETDTRTAPRGLKVAPLATAAPRTVEYAETSPGTWTPTFAYDPRVGGPRSDAERLADGWTTLTFLPVERTPPTDGQRRLDALVDRSR